MQQFQAVHYRHFNVRKNQICFILLEHLKSFRSVVRYSGQLTRRILGNAELQPFTDHDFIIHDQNFHGSPPFLQDLLGISRVTVVPIPRALSIVSP